MGYLFLISISAMISITVQSIYSPSEIASHIGKFVGTFIIVIPLAVYYIKRKPLFFSTTNNFDNQSNSNRTENLSIDSEVYQNSKILQEKLVVKESIEISELNDDNRENATTTKPSNHRFSFSKYRIPMIFVLFFIIIIVQSVFIYNQAEKIDQLAQQIKVINDEISPLVNAEDHNSIRFKSVDQQLTNIRRSLTLIDKDLKFLKHNAFGWQVQPLNYDEWHEYNQMIKGENN